MDLYFEIAGNQIDGARDYQEDAFLTTYIDDESSGESKSSGLVVMADGMGGHAAGNIASNLVVSTFNKSFTGAFGKQETHEVLRESLLKANDALKSSIKETPALDGMGCTTVTATFSRGKVWWVSVGDSHLYLIRDKELIKKNEDHSYGGYLDRMKSQGMEVEAEPGLSRNMLMSAMTGEEIAEIDCPAKPFDLKPGDRLLIASDGLDTLSAGVIIQTSEWSSTPKECVDALLKAVEDAGKPRQDNTTVIVVDVLEREAPPKEEPAPAPAQPVEIAASQAVAEAEPKGKGGLIGIVAVVLIAAGAGGYFVLGGKQEAMAPQPAAPGVEVAEPAAGEGEPETAPPAEPATAEPQVEQPAAGAEPQPAAAAQPAEPAPRPAAEEFRDRLASGGEGPVMVALAGGTFKMGSSGMSVNQDERPRHEVTVKPFAMSKHEITFAEYEPYAQATGRAIPDNLYMDKAIHPVIFVSWDDAYNYTRWLSEQTGKTYRLPTEAEWEYAAASNTTTPYWWGYDLEPNRAHCFGCETGLDPRKPTQIGRFAPNPFGLYDTAGNVMEWVHDCYHPSYQGAPSDGGIWEGGDCTYRVARGGSYHSPPTSIRSAKRAKLRSTTGYDEVGIRIVREP